MTAPVLNVTPAGVIWPLRLAADPDAVQARVVTCLGTQLGEWSNDIDFGLPIEDWTTRSVVPLVEVQSVVRVQVARIVGVLEVVRVEATRAAGVIAVTVVYRSMGQGGRVVDAIARSWPDYASGIAFTGGFSGGPGVASGQGA